MADALPDVRAAFSPQPDGVEWPTRRWPTGSHDPAVDALVDVAFGDPALGQSYAVLVVRDGAVIAERYGGALPSFTHPPTPVTEATRLLSWSMAKSFLHAAVGVLVDDGALDPEAAAPVPEWQGEGDPRGAITLRQLLEMRDGIAWCEDYVDAGVSDTIEMLFGSGKDDVAGYTAAHPLAVAPGTRFLYSSGTSNVLARIVGDVVGRGEGTDAFLRERLCTPLGMDDARFTFDAAGTFVASSFLYCTARSMARFATLYLRGGTYDGRRILSERWAAEAQLPTAVDDDPNTYFSRHWWLDGSGVYWAAGHEGQRALVVPDANAVVVRYGRTTTDEGVVALRSWCDQMVVALGHRP
jgi:CubicO group peptidase (beta-lactamase class C family)